MKYLVIGSGGREHAIAWRLMNDGSASEVYVAPGNGGIDTAYRVSLKIDDFSGIEDFCREKKIDTVIVGPEVPLVAGLVDYLQSKSIRVFGPTQEAAMLEGSKLFSKKIMNKYNVPTAQFHEFTGKEEIISFLQSVTEYPIVIKLDGLAAGKGVAIPESTEEAESFINENVAEDQKVFIEDYFIGEEASVLGISDGKTILPFIAAQDHKRVYEDDRGPNTGGMGAYAPAPVMTEERINLVREKVLQPVIDGMAAEGKVFKGILYAGIMINENDINVLEFNVRFGDPEAQVVLPLLKNRLGDVIEKAIDGNLHQCTLEFKDDHAITVVLASGGYPGSYEKGKVIQGLDAVDDDIIVFHAGTDRSGRDVVTSGGRVLNVTATGETLVSAAEKVYSQIEKISFEGAFYRRDIGHRAL